MFEHLQFLDDVAVIVGIEFLAHERVFEMP